MKKLLTIAVAAALFTSTGAIAQKKETRNVGAFSQLNFGVPGTLHLKQGATQSVVLEGDPEFLEKIETEVSGGRLTIKSEDRWKFWNWGDDKITAYVTMTNIEGLSVSGSGRMIGEGTFRSAEIDLNVSGSGKMEIEIEARGEMEADVSGSGDMLVRGSCSDIDGDVSGSGNMRLVLGTTNEASFDITGSGRIEVSGSSNKMETSISGSGVLRGANFQTKTCEVRITGSGNVEIGVSDELDAHITGSGGVSYRGNPSKVNSHSSGSGKVRQM
ncbi:MAG TPA: head GIN domain-containing protein [Cyclobacteriaceae bacterium]